jgi:hypothetical protein
MQYKKNPEISHFLLETWKKVEENCALTLTKRETNPCSYRISMARVQP